MSAVSDQICRMKKKFLFIAIIFLTVFSGHAQSYVPELDNPKIKVQPVIPIKGLCI